MESEIGVACLSRKKKMSHLESVISSIDLPWDLLPGPVAVVDVETTGLSSNSHRIVEIAGIRMQRNRRWQVLDTLVNRPSHLNGVDAGQRCHGQHDAGLAVISHQLLWRIDIATLYRTDITNPNDLTLTPGQLAQELHLCEGAHR